MSKIRTKLEIEIQILEVCKTKQKKTHIQEKVNLYHTRMEKYLDRLADKGFLARKEFAGDLRTHEVFITTMKGINLLRLWKDFLAWYEL